MAKLSQNFFPNASWGSSDLPQVDGANDYEPSDHPPMLPPVYGHATPYFWQASNPYPQGLVSPPIDSHWNSYPMPQTPFFSGHFQQPQVFPMPPTPQSTDESANESPAKASAPPAIRFEETDSAEELADPLMGGLAIALTHGSVLFECAKHELHATTALKQPNRFRPTRIGLVFYHHKNLNYPQHGATAYEGVLLEKYDRDYLAYLEGRYVPSPVKLRQMQSKGYKLVSSLGYLLDVKFITFIFSPQVSCQCQSLWGKGQLEGK